MYSTALPVEIQVFQDRDLVLAELFQEERLALSWAQQYAERLRQHGWCDSTP